MLDPVESNFDKPSMNSLWNIYKCKFCTYRTRFRCSIISHVRQHKARAENHQYFNCYLHPPEKYDCEKCDHFQSHLKVFSTSHFNTCHRAQGIHHYQHFPKLILRSCKKCDFQTYSLLVLLNHNCCNKLVKVEKIRHFQCGYCSYKATQKVNLQVHVLRKHTPSEQINWCQCEQCPYKSKEKRELRRHVLTHHAQHDNPKRLFQCPYCSYKATQKGNLKVHTVRKHTSSEQIAWFKCEHCTYKAKDKYKLRRHMLTRHTQPSELEKLNKCFKCDHCPYKTPRNEYLRAHVLRIHTPSEEINWFKCEICSYKAKEKKGLYQHVFTRHKRPKEVTWFNCPHCFFKSKFKRCLNRHLTIHV